MAETNNSLGVSLKEDVKSFLAAIKFTYSENDDWMLMFCIEKVTNTIKNECNISSIPEGLKQVAVQRVVGEFLFTKKNSGQTDGFENIDFSAVIKQIQEGDTNTVFAIGEGCSTPEEMLNSLISILLTSGNNQFVTYRRLKW